MHQSEAMHSLVGCAGQAANSHSCTMSQSWILELVPNSSYLSLHNMMNCAKAYKAWKTKATHVLRWLVCMNEVLKEQPRTSGREYWRPRPRTPKLLIKRCDFTKWTPLYQSSYMLHQVIVRQQLLNLNVAENQNQQSFEGIMKRGTEDGKRSLLADNAI